MDVAWRASISFRSMTSTELGSSCFCSSSREAVTTMRSPNGVRCGVWASAGITPPRIPTSAKSWRTVASLTKSNAPTAVLGVGRRGARQPCRSLLHTPWSTARSAEGRSGRDVGRGSRSPGFRIALLPDLPTRRTASRCGLAIPFAQWFLRFRTRLQWRGPHRFYTGFPLGPGRRRGGGSGHRYV
jgi:hypothetical protein